MHNKFNLYQESGVREYWLVESAQSAVLIYVLNDDGKYIGLPPAVELAQSSIFPDLKIDLGKVFN
nr:Uma2 family endonuclease [Dyadobacter sp. CY261]